MMKIVTIAFIWFVLALAVVVAVRPMFGPREGD